MTSEIAPETHNEDLDKDDRRDKWRAGFVVMALLLVAALAWALLAQSNKSEDRATSEASQKFTLAQQVAAACALKEQADDLGGLCTSAKQIVKEGPEGKPGLQGPPGDQGPEGPLGPKGEQGIQGFQGVAGPAGALGKPGANGKDGAVGANGADGATGPQGPPGPAGSDGADGATGPQGPAGETGVVNVKTVGCESPPIQSITSSYDETTRTITITCN